METFALTEAVYYILLSLYSPMHGYGIMQNVAKLSNGRVNLAAGTLYGAIGTLCDRGWIQSQGDCGNDRRKEYAITPLGQTAVQAEIGRLRELLENGVNITGGNMV